MALNGTLSPAQRRAIDALMASRNVADAAKVAGVGLRTLWRWMTQPAFMTALNQAQADALNTTIRLLSASSVDAVGVLADTMKDAAATDGAKLRAADVMLSRLVALKQTVDFETRLQALEIRTNGKH